MKKWGTPKLSVDFWPTKYLGSLVLAPHSSAAYPHHTKVLCCRLDADSGHCHQLLFLAVVLGCMFAHW